LLYIYIEIFVFSVIKLEHDTTNDHFVCQHYNITDM